MATFGDFSSLLQLGVGTGIGLSVFRAPIDIRTNKIARTIAQELVALNESRSDFAKFKRRDILDIKYRLDEQNDRLNSVLIYFMIAALIGASANLIALVDCTLNPDISLSRYGTMWLVFLSSGWFLVELAALELIARATLTRVHEDLQKIRKRRLTPD